MEGGYTMNTIRIAVLGLNQGYKLAVDAEAMPGIELAAVAGMDALSARRAEAMNKPLYTDYKTLIDEVPLDCACIALPNRLHREAVEYCAAKGIHVLCEKPIADNLADAQAIIDVCKKNKVKLLVGHHRRSSSKLREIRDIIASGKLGELIAVHFMWVLAKDRPYFNVPWRVAPGGGPLLINSIHDIDDLRFTTGMKIDKVYAAARSNIRRNRVEDSISIVMETKDGPTATYCVSDGIPAPWSYELTARENPNFKFADNHDCYFFMGTKGSLAFPSMRFYTYDEDQYGWYSPLKIEKLKVTDNDPMKAELEHFIDVVRGAAEPVCTGEDALESLKVIMAIKESAETGNPVWIG